jgi:hypothetical protein
MTNTCPKFMENAYSMFVYDDSPFFWQRLYCFGETEPMTLHDTRTKVHVRPGYI